jgi:hypothetical protein
MNVDQKTSGRVVYRRGVFTAAALVFLAGIAGALSVTGNFGRFCRPLGELDCLDIPAVVFKEVTHRVDLV